MVSRARARRVCFSRWNIVDRYSRIQFCVFLGVSLRFRAANIRITKKIPRTAIGIVFAVIFFHDIISLSLSLSLYRIFRNFPAQPFASRWNASLRTEESCTILRFSQYSVIQMLLKGGWREDPYLDIDIYAYRNSRCFSLAARWRVFFDYTCWKIIVALKRRSPFLNLLQF